MTEENKGIDLCKVLDVNKKQLRIALVDFQKLQDNYIEEVKKLCRRKYRCKVSPLLSKFAGKVAELTREYDKAGDEELNRDKQD